jgi:predicted helicase
MPSTKRLLSNTHRHGREPPYSSGQDSANDNNANEKYPTLDAAIRDTYAARSTATLKNSLYDSYIRAIKWGSLRIKERGVLAFVTNGGWLDSNTADGMRLSLAEEFSAIHVLNLRGNQRTAGEQSRKEGGKVFDAGSRATVAITVLVKDPIHVGPITIQYTDIGDYLSREEKLAKVSDSSSVGRLAASSLNPNLQGDWVNQRRDDFESFAPVSPKGGAGAILGSSSSGLKTNRDAWAYSFSTYSLRRNMSKSIQTFNADSERLRGTGVDQIPGLVTSDAREISWDVSLYRQVGAGTQLEYQGQFERIANYRPFSKQRVYFDAAWNPRQGQMPSLFPLGAENFGFYFNGPGSSAPFTSLMVSDIPDLAFPGAGNPGQFCSRWRYERVSEGRSLFDAGVGEAVDSYRRIDNITDEALGRFRAAYGEAFTKDDIFFYVYGLLHSPEYRDTYAADLKKMLPRIPLVEDAQPFVDAGRKLSELHLGYESVTPYPLDGLDVDAGDGDTAYDVFRVEKMSFAKKRDPETNKLVADKSTVIYNDRITLSGIPDDAHRYMLGSRSAVEWIIDRYQVKTDKASGIVNDPNDWSREVGDPRYIIDLLARIVTVSLETMKIVDALPPLDILENQQPEKAS